MFNWLASTINKNCLDNTYPTHPSLPCNSSKSNPFSSPCPSRHNPPKYHPGTAPNFAGVLEGSLPYRHGRQVFWHSVANVLRRKRGRTTEQERVGDATGVSWIVVRQSSRWSRQHKKALQRLNCSTILWRISVSDLCRTRQLSILTLQLVPGHRNGGFQCQGMLGQLFLAVLKCTIYIWYFKCNDVQWYYDIINVYIDAYRYTYMYCWVYIHTHLCIYKICMNLHTYYIFIYNSALLSILCCQEYECVYLHISYDHNHVFFNKYVYIYIHMSLCICFIL